jgi:hypothetical protein
MYDLLLDKSHISQPTLEQSPRNTDKPSVSGRTKAIEDLVEIGCADVDSRLSMFGRKNRMDKSERLKFRTSKASESDNE